MSSLLQPDTSSRAFDLGGATEPLPPRRDVSRLPGLIVGGVVTTGVITYTLTGNTTLASIPAMLALALWAVWTQPLRRLLIPIVFAQCFFFEPAAQASSALWYGFMQPGYKLTNLHLNKSLPIGALSISGQELAYVLLLGLIGIRLLRGDKVDTAGRGPTANVIFAFLAIEIMGIALFEVWGIANGGNFKYTLFQIRHLIWLALEVVVLSFAFRNARDFRTLAITITLAAALKGAVGMYFLSQDVWRHNIEAVFMTGHQDSVLYVTVIFMWLAAWVHSQSWQRMVAAFLVFAWMAFVIYLNNRRLAWVGLAGSLMAFYPLVTGKLKRRINLTLIYSSPLIAIYLALATTHSEGIFAPGADLMGIANVTDASSQWRVMENYDLIYTLRQHRLFGSGFGHEWIEIIRLPDVSGAYAEYRLLAHNSVLWLLGITGIVGFTMIWMPIVVTVFLARRSYHFATTSYQKTAAATAIAMAVCYVNQAWGDVGLGQPAPTFLMAAALALAGKLAAETGAWPSGLKLVDRKSDRLATSAAGLGDPAV
jgi:hypothetical protein